MPSRASHQLGLGQRPYFGRWRRYDQPDTADDQGSLARNRLCVSSR